MSGNKVCDNESKMQEILGNFQLPKPYKRNWGNFRIKGNVVEYVANKTTQVWNGETHTYEKDPDPETNVIAIKTRQGKLLGNASILPLVGQTSAWGNTQPNYRQTTIQKLMEKSGRFQMVPFNVMQEANLDMDSFETLEESGAETIERNRENPDYDDYKANQAEQKGEEYKTPKEIPEKAHFIGSQLFSVSGTKFLFDIDRVEIKHGIFNPFLVQIPDAENQIDTIEKAYQSLIPVAVQRAMNEGLDVKRQGEWFFIPTHFDPTVPPPEEKKEIITDQERVMMKILSRNSYGEASDNLRLLWGEEVFARIQNLNVLEREGDPYEAKTFALRAGKNRPNRAEFGINRDGVSYVMGDISHTGREHKTINLAGWHTAQPNTAISSFTITGDID